MKSSSLKRHGLVLCTFLMCLIVVGNGKVYSQIPDPCAVTPPYPEWIEWQNDDCEEVTLPSGCVVEICYCSRTDNSQKQFLIKSYREISGCENTTWEDINYNSSW